MALQDASFLFSQLSSWWTRLWGFLLLGLGLLMLSAIVLPASHPLNSQPWLNEVQHGFLEEVKTLGYAAAVIAMLPFLLAFLLVKALFGWLPEDAQKPIFFLGVMGAFLALPFAIKRLASFSPPAAFASLFSAAKNWVFSLVAEAFYTASCLLPLYFLSFGAVRLVPGLVDLNAVVIPVFLVLRGAHLARLVPPVHSVLASGFCFFAYSFLGVVQPALFRSFASVSSASVAQDDGLKNLFFWGYSTTDSNATARRIPSYFAGYLAVSIVLLATLLLWFSPFEVHPLYRFLLELVVYAVVSLALMPVAYLFSAGFLYGSNWLRPSDGKKSELESVVNASIVLWVFHAVAWVLLFLAIPLSLAAGLSFTLLAGFVAAAYFLASRFFPPERWFPGVVSCLSVKTGRRSSRRSGNVLASLVSASGSKHRTLSAAFWNSPPGKPQSNRRERVPRRRAHL